MARLKNLSALYLYGTEVNPEDLKCFYAIKNMLRIFIEKEKVPKDIKKTPLDVWGKVGEVYIIDDRGQVKNAMGQPVSPDQGDYLQYEPIGQEIRQSP